MICKNCKKEIPDESIFCPYCGQKTLDDKIICPNCGCEIAEGYVFCPSCGTKVSDDSIDKTETIDTLSDDVKSEYSDVDETEETPIKKEQDVKAISVNNTNNKKSFSKKNRYVICRDIVLVALCLIMFIFSFYTIKTYELDSEYYGYNSKIEIDGVSSIEAIKLMFVTSRDYNGDVSSNQMKRLYTKLEDAAEKLEKGIESGKNIDKETHDYVIVLLEYYLSMEDNGSSLETTTIFFGLFSLLFICFNGIMLIFSVVTLVFHICGKGIKIQNYNKILCICLFFLLLILFIQGSVLGNSDYVSYVINEKVNGIGIVSLIMSLIYIGFAFADYIYLSKDNNNVWYKKLLKASIPTILVIIACSCVFAPAAKAVYYKDGNQETVNLYADVLLDAQISDEMIKYYNRVDDSTAHTDFHNDIVDYIGNDLQVLFNDKDWNLKTHDIVAYTLLDMLDYEKTDALSIGYYFVLFTFILAGVGVSILLMGDEIKHKICSSICMDLTIVFLIVAIVTCAILVVLIGVNYDWYDVTGLEVKIGPSFITSTIFMIFAFVSYVLLSFLKSNVVIKVKDKEYYVQEVGYKDNHKHVSITKDISMAMLFKNRSIANEFIEDNLSSKKNLFEVVLYKKKREKKEIQNVELY